MIHQLPAGVRQFLLLCKVQDWIDDPARCNLAEWFDDIATFVALVKSHNLDDVTTEVISLIKKCLHKNVDFNNFMVQDSGYVIGENWPKVLEAGAWAMGDRYDAAVAGGQHGGSPIEA